MNRGFRTLLCAAVAGLAPAAAHGQLAIANVSAPAINCKFASSCTVTVSDQVAPLPGGGRLQSRTYRSEPGSPGAGMYVYEYRLDLTAAPGAPAVTSLTVDFGPVVGSMNFDDAGAPDEVFVVMGGGLGSVGPSQATQTGRNVTFRFPNGVAGGQTSYFFGMVSRFAPGNVRASVTTRAGAAALTARGPVPGGGNGNPGGSNGPVAAEDCIRYNNQSLAIRDEGASGFLLTDGSSRLLMLSTRADADRALALAQRHTHQCFVGRSNSRPNRKQYIMQYWRGNGASTPISPEDCLPYGSSVAVVDRGALGWRMEDGTHYMQLFDNQADANRGLMVARAFSNMCYIGRDNARSNRYDYIVQYWR